MIIIKSHVTPAGTDILIFCKTTLFLPNLLTPLLTQTAGVGVAKVGIIDDIVKIIILSQQIVEAILSSQF